MNTQQPKRGNGAASTVLMIIGGTMMLIALVGALALYFWGQTPPPGGGEQWNDLIASIFIVYGCLPVFLIGLLLLLLGVFQKVRSKGKAAQADH